ncbi:MAG: hypothetical protein Q8K75_05530 [Chlamydiales bacterium]|nr:hypothetical protein [Chlamydiales bacterium]
MQKLLFKVFICLFGAGLALYASVREQNSLMDLRRAIPPIAKEVKALEEENHRLEYIVDRFENPVHLIELSREPQYGHLRYPYVQDIVVLPRVPQ